MKNLIEALWELANEQFPSINDNSIPVTAFFQKIEIAGGGDILLPPTSWQWFENLVSWCLCWWPVLQKPGKLREAPSIQIMDRCALKALRTRIIPAVGLDDLKCLFKPKWFPDNSSSIFRSPGMSSKSSLCSLPIKARRVLRLSGVPHLHKQHRRLSRCAWRYKQPVSVQHEIISQNYQKYNWWTVKTLLPSSPLTLKSFGKKAVHKQWTVCLCVTHSYLLVHPLSKGSSVLMKGAKQLEHRSVYQVTTKKTC